MTARGPVLVTALVAMCTAALLWLALWPGDGAGAAAAPGTALERATEDEPEADLATPRASAEPAQLESGSATEAERPGRARSVVPPAWSAPLRGRMLDRRTEDGVPQLMIQIKKLGPRSRTDLALTDDGGWFESPVAYERTGLRLTAFDVLDDGFSQGIADKGWSHYAQAPELLWRVDVGPTFRPSAVGGPAGAEWKARLREVNRDGQERAWSWVEIDASEGWPAWIRYRKAEHWPEPGWAPRLQVADASERWSGETPVPSSVGQHPEPIQVVVEARAGAVHGTVTDSDGRPVAAHVLLVFGDPGDGQAWVEAGTDARGAYALEGAPGGVHRLMVQTDHRPVARFVVEVVMGRITTRDVVLPHIDVAGDVRGALIGPSGGGEPVAFVHLESLEGGATSQMVIAGFWIFSDPDGEERSEFAFEDLPAGRYTVRLRPMDGRRYDRLTAEVQVPAEEVLFTTAEAAEDEIDYVLRVVDASTGDVLPEASLLWRFGPVWSPDVETGPGETVESGPSMMDLAGVACAPGYLPRKFVPADFEREGDRVLMEVPLERGHGAALVMLDADRLMGGSEARFDDWLPAEGISGARVVVAGRVVGTSDATGLALVDARNPIDAFEVRAPGWVELTRLRFQDHARTPDGVGFVLMVRE